MTSVVRSFALCFVAMLALTSCKPEAHPITGKEWTVVAIGDLLAPVGIGGRALTMRFDDSTKRVYGFSGCNQYSASYVLGGDSLTLGPAIGTRMACLEFDSVEQAFLGRLPEMTKAEVSGSVLILSGNDKAIRLQ